MTKNIHLTPSNVNKHPAIISTIHESLKQAVDQPIKKVYWQDIRNAIEQCDPHCAKLIDTLDPDEKLPFYLTRYQYGDMIVKQGQSYLPLPNGKLVHLRDSQLDKELQRDLSYSGNALPAGIVLNNSLEIFTENNTRVLPWMVYQPGEALVLYPEFNHPLQQTNDFFNITAGARSIFMIPHIGDIALHKNLQRDFEMRLPPPKNLLDQWTIFRKLCRQHMTNCDWHMQLLFF